MNYELTKFEIREDVAIISLNDPAALNAMSPDMIHEVRCAMDEAVLGNARAVMLRGEGRAFCAGANLRGMGAETLMPHEKGKGLEVGYNPMMRQLHELPMPVVSAVHGAVAGVGSSLALSADMIVAAESAYFLQAFCNIGLVPDGGATYLLTRSLSRARAMEMMLLGERLPAPKALEWGLINQVVPDDQVEEAGFALASKLADGPTGALAAIRRLARQAQEASLIEQMDNERAAQAARAGTLEQKEGVAAFREKRPANYRAIKPQQ